MTRSPRAGGHGHGAGAVPAVLLHQVLRQALDGGEPAPRPAPHAPGPDPRLTALALQHVSMACVHLASKIEEAPRRIRDVVNVFHRLRHLREKRWVSGAPGPPTPGPALLDTVC